MPRRDEYVPKHRGPAPEPALTRRVRRTAVLSGVAVATTGLAVSTGVLTQSDTGGQVNAALRAAPQIDADDLEGRDRPVSRSDGRDQVDQDKLTSLDQSSGGQATRTEDLSEADPRDIARAMLPEHGFAADQFGCLDALYVSESGWDPTADNPSSSAYGIPQALTETHDDLPADYMTNPASQIEWGLDYIRSSYGTPCSAWEFKQANNWY
ncbi:MAG: lytic transglycosylase domain-containing protein [Nocardioides sp.]